MIWAQTVSCMSNWGKERRDSKEGRQATMLCRELSKVEKSMTYRFHGEVVQPGESQVRRSRRKVAKGGCIKFIANIYVVNASSCILCSIPRVEPNAMPVPIVTTVVRKTSNCMLAFQP